MRVYDLQGRVRHDAAADHLSVAPGGAVQALTLPRLAWDSRVFFVRCELFDQAGKRVADNVYWQSQRLDDVGDPRNDWAFELKQSSWADMTALNQMSPAPLEVSARRIPDAHANRVAVRLHNPTSRVAFFERVELTSTRDGDEILPIEYSDNYVTVFPGETVDVQGDIPTGGADAAWVRVTGYNSPATVVPIE